MLNLRQLSEPEHDSSTSDDTGHVAAFSAPNFRAFSDTLGNLGEPLDFEESLQLSDEAEEDVFETDVGESTLALGDAPEGDENRRCVAGRSWSTWDSDCQVREFIPR